MKKLLFTALLCWPLLCLAQNQIAENFYQTHQGEESVAIDFKGFLLKSLFETEEGKEASNFIDRFSLYSFDKAETSISEGEAKRLRKAFKRQGFEELLYIKDGNDIVEFSIIEKDNVISEVMMLVNAEDSFTLMSVTGKIDLKTLAKADIEVNGKKPLQHLDDERP